MRKLEPIPKKVDVESDSNPISKEAFLVRMENIFYSSGKDVEGCHGAMDDLMCEVLRSLGYGDGVDVFEAAEKWYA